MIWRWIFWRQPLEVRGAAPAAEVAGRIRSLLAQGVRFSVAERLVGTIDGMSVAVTKRAILAGASDVVEFRGTIASDGKGCVIRGQVSWKLGTRIQFAGFPLLGLFIAGTGAMQRLYGTANADDVTLFGAGIFVVSLMWLLAAYGMKDKQIAYIEGKLAELAA